ncbi:MAG TPA: hypothetical protein VMZ53_12915 [Kofleriaceae bacterium]|nr:hypothetical protein [Kofleriaceae bacterium]
MKSLKVAASKPKWRAEVFLDATGGASNVYTSTVDTVFRLTVFADEWNLLVSKPGAATSIRVHDTVELDDQLKVVKGKSPPPLSELGSLLVAAEAKLGVKFPRDKIFIRTNLAGAKAALTKWIGTL